MICPYCKFEIRKGQKFCPNCGKLVQISKDTPPDTETYSDLKPTLGLGKRWGKKILGISVLIFFAIAGIYGSLDEESKSKNNSGLSAFNEGDNKKALADMSSAREKAFTDGAKLDTSLNLAYIYSSEQNDMQALKYFKDALSYAQNNSFEYFLIAGEIELLEQNSVGALEKYKKAYNLKPDDFQINNALNLFYLDPKEKHTDLADYKKALEYAKKADQISAEETKNIAKQNLGIAYYFNEDYNQTINLLKGFDLNKEPYIAIWLGLAYASKGDFVNAKIFLQRGIDGGAEVPQEVTDFLNSN